jgi:hypothetical protein
MKKIKDLSQADKLELREFYDGTWEGTRELANRFDINFESLRYFLNHKNFRKRRLLIAKKWWNNNREKSKRRCRKYYYKNKLKNLCIKKLSK